MVKLSKAIIRKYGISKKAWAVARGGRKSTTKIKARRLSMAKRRYKRHSRSEKGGFMGKAGQILLGSAVAGLYEVFISPMIPLSRNIKNIVELVLGIFLASSRRMPTFVRAGGLALATINAFEIIVPLLSSGKSAVSGGSSGLSGFLQG